MTRPLRVGRSCLSHAVFLNLRGLAEDVEAELERRFTASSVASRQATKRTKKIPFCTFLCVLRPCEASFFNFLTDAKSTKGMLFCAFQALRALV
jgi:hypothetical protein